MPRTLPDSFDRLGASVDRGDIRGLPDTGGSTPGTTIGFSDGVPLTPRGTLAFAARYHSIHLPREVDYASGVVARLLRSLGGSRHGAQQVNASYCNVLAPRTLQHNADSGTLIDSMLAASNTK